MWLLRITALIAALFPFSVNALEGDIDAEDQYPSIVLLRFERGICTGFVYEPRIIFTAAHCLVRSDGAYVTEISIQFKDAVGKDRTVPGKDIFLPDGFADVAMAIRREQSLADSDRKQPNINVKHSKHARYLVDDFAIIVPDGDVHVKQNISTLLEEPLVKQQPPVVKSSTDTVQHEVIIAGFGVHFCDSKKDNSSCLPDLKRRFAAFRLFRLILDAEYPTKISTIWYTAKDGDAKKPRTREGDSGAPVVYRRPDGSQLVIGVHSGSTADNGFASPLPLHRQLVAEVKAGTRKPTATTANGASAVAAVNTRGANPRFGVGWAHADTAQAAEKGALADCRKRAKAECSVVTVHRAGCRFATSGKSKRMVGWLVKRTEKEVVDECRKNGMSCTKPIGGCLS